MRFRAYATDSEDEDDNVSVSNASADEIAATPSRMRKGKENADASMHEDEPGLEAPRKSSTPRKHKTTRKQRKRNKAAESDDEEDMAAVDAVLAGEASQGPRVHFASPPNDRSIIPWAREIGVDAHKMHVMQASLFGVPEEEAQMKKQAEAQKSASRRKLAMTASLLRKHRRDSDGEGVRADSGQRASFADDLPSKPFRPTRKYARVEVAASVVGGNEGLVADAGLAFGRSFRVGWGPGGTLVHLGQLCAPHSIGHNAANSSIVQKVVVPLVAEQQNDVPKLASKLLSHHLRSTPIEPDANGVPFASPPPSLNFASLMTQFPGTERSFQTSLFRLGHALFDPINLRLTTSSSPELHDRITAIRRKAALSKWLQEAISSSVDAEVRDHPGADWAGKVFALLTSNQVERACAVAMDGGNVKLASLIAQQPGDEDLREDLQTQLALWREERVDAHIDETVRKIYAVLAGIVDTLQGSDGRDVERCSDVNITKGLCWKRAFGLQLWYGQPLDATVGDAFEAYDTLWQQPASNVAPPFPWYAEQDSAPPSPWKHPSSANPPDILFSLIKMFTDPACSLSSILTPLSFSASPADYSLVWHLYIILSRCLGVRDLEDRETVEGELGTDDGEVIEGHSPSADLLANSYSMQLEELGMIQEAAFVLLHIEGSAGRARAIKALLGRSAAKLDDWMTRGLVGSLKIPLAWVDEAKAVHALDDDDPLSAYKLYVSAGLYNAAHELAVNQIAPYIVIRDDLSLLKEIFSKLKGHRVDGWHVRGKVFLDYAHAMTRLPELRAHLMDKTTIPDAAEAVELEELSRSVPKLIGVLPDVLHDRTNEAHNAAVAGMTSALTRLLDKVKPVAVHQSQVRTLFMTEDIRLRNVQTAAMERFMRSIKAA